MFSKIWKICLFLYFLCIGVFGLVMMCDCMEKSHIEIEEKQCRAEKERLRLETERIRLENERNRAEVFEELRK